ncbi:dut protein [Latilactobacillus sakei subsp. carnosus DSM 15831]|nr:dut protein [Latilactobacillus sakei subsp. carnosus DSM 15831]
MIRNGKPLVDDDFERASKTLKPFLVPTGIKAYMQDDEYLMIANRSSNPLKKGLVIPNGVGIIDSDYYGNDANEGEIFIQMLNFSPRDVILRKGERIGQGIFMPYLVADDEVAVTTKRTGGFGSSGR